MLLLNHFIVLNNMFGADAAITLLLFKIEKEAQAVFKNTIAAREGLEIKIPA